MSKKEPSDFNKLLLERARRMRTNQTRAEAQLWFYLRKHGLDGRKFKRQVRLGDYIVDFYCHAGRLVVEVDGGQHFEEQAKEADRVRTTFIESLGLRVLRFSNSEVLGHSDLVRTAILEALAEPE